MRASEPTIYENSKGEICTIVLEGDYYAEHEHGIEALLEILGIPPLRFGEGGIPQDYQGPWGIDRILTTRIPSEQYGEFELTYEKETKSLLPYCCLSITASYMGTPKEPWLERSKKRRAKPRFPYEETTAAWDSEGFKVATVLPKVADFLRKFGEGLLKKEGSSPVCIWLRGPGENPFARRGICLGIPDLIDPKNKETFAEAEQGIAQLHWAAEATGIPKRIPSSWFYALKPGPTLKNRVGKGPYPETFETKHPIMFFLNPRDQRRNNHGWFTVEELEAWTRGEGPIPK